MPKQYHSQRQHIILSLDTVCYQLHTLSFILSPSIWSFICRLISQFQCSKPRDLDPAATRSLRFFFANILLLNLSSIWYHVTQGAAEGRAIVLDFVGMSYTPSKLQLLGLDFIIVFLQLVLTTIAYETSFYEHHTETGTHDMLLPIPSSPPPLFTPIPFATLPTVMPRRLKPSPPKITPPYIIDLRIAPVLERLRNPPPASQPRGTDSSLPLPNTTPWPLPQRMRMLLRASSRLRNEGEGNIDGSPGLPGSLATRGR